MMEGYQGDGDRSAGSSSTDQHSKVQEFKNSGNEKFNKNNYKGAIADYKKGLLLEPNNPDLHANMSAAYLHLEKYIEAEEYAVYAIHLRPNFYKGYMRAAKAAHGKAMTRLALKRLNAGLKAVTDPNGIKELTRLKTQYTSYLSLKRNADRELNFDSDTYQSEDEEELSCEDDDDSTDEEPVQPPTNPPYILCGLNSSKQEEEEWDQKLPPEPLKKPHVCVELAEKPKNVKESKKDGTSQGSAGPRPSKGSTENLGATRSDQHKQQIMRSMSSQCSENDTKDESNASSEESHDEDPVHETADCQKSFVEKLRELTRDPELKNSISEFQEHMKAGGEAFLNGNFRKASESYKMAKDRVGHKLADFGIDDRQYHVIKYAHYAALINMNTYDNLVKAITHLQEMMTYQYSIPAIHIQLARAYYKLNRFKAALEPLEKLQELLDNCPIFPTFTWPGTIETIQETTPTGLKNAMKELQKMCRVPHKPTAVCRFDNCSKISTHIIPSELIYQSDPDFAGYVRMICEEKCHIEYHVSCWKAYKESIGGINKISDKDLLGRNCLTTDCVNSVGDPSVVTVIEIIGTDNQVKCNFKLEHKTNLIEQNKKTKKKKSKSDEKEKDHKAKKSTEKKARVRQVKKTATVVEEEDEPTENAATVCTDPVKALEIRRKAVEELRTLNFGLKEEYWNPKLPFYGRPEESVKASTNQFLDSTNSDENAVRDAKEFVFSYFTSILKDEGPLKQTEIENLWKDSAGDFCDMTVVLPHLKSMCELLLESTRFCQLEDYICLSDQLEEAYESVKSEVSETVKFLMTGNSNPTEVKQTVAGHTQLSGLPDLLNHPTSDTNLQTVFLNSQTSSEDGSEYESDESDESEEENSEEEDLAVNRDVATGLSELPVNKEDELLPQMTLPKPLDDGNFSLKQMLNEISRLKNILMKGAEDKETSQNEPTNNSDEVSNEEVITAQISANMATMEMETSWDPIPSDKKDSETSIKENLEMPLESNIDGTVENVNAPNNIEQISTHMENVDDQSNAILLKNTSSEAVSSAKQESFDILECDKASQIECPTEEREVQTSAMETKDTLSQTKETDQNIEEVSKKVQELTTQLQALRDKNLKLSKELSDKEALNRRIKKSHDEALARLREENRKTLEIHSALQEQMKKDFMKSEAEFKNKEMELTTGLKKMQEMYASVLCDNGKLKKEYGILSKETGEVKQSLALYKDTLKEHESKYKVLESKMQSKLQTFQHFQIATIKLHWESQINMLKRRCIEKISEMQSWFSMFPPEEVEDLPSWGLIRQNTLQWSEISKKVQEIEANFQAKYIALEKRIANGEEIDELSSLILPPLPEEPTPLPLDKIHKEITQKHIKKIGELTQLVVSQQLEIEKSKETNQQIQQIMNSIQMGQMGMSRMQTPLTTAFGSLALQYPYPQNLPSQLPVPTIPPLAPDTSKIGSAAQIVEKMRADVQTLLKESSKPANFTSSSVTQSMKEDTVSRGQTPPLNKSFAFPPPTMFPPPSVPGMSMPPPPVGVAQNLLKTSNVFSETKERESSPKPEVKVGSSRESTPGPTPTPEKAKKKKKGKSESKEPAEARSVAPVHKEAASTVVFDPHQAGDVDWCVVGGPKSTVTKQSTASAPVSESKLKNKKKLLDKLQLKFPTISLKELDDIVKLVREENNGSLSGLPFDDIEKRVERVVVKKQMQKNSTMGLIKFSDAAWKTVKQEEIIKWSSLQFEECTICLEPLMGKERTKVDCNHEFHTKCLRKWLKEKSVCPLCNKYTTMPDEFPAL